MTFKESYSAYKKDINETLDVFFQDIRQDFSDRPEFLESYEKIKDFCLRGGKRIRPILVIVGYQAVGGENYEAIRKASIYAELLHNYLLIHDDVIDQDTARRRGKTIHYWYEGDFSATPDPKHLGESLAIVDGDIVESLAQRVLVEADFPDDLKIRALKEYNDAVLYTGLGQKLDVLSEVCDFGYEDVMAIHKLKTAHYTFSRPLRVGGILGGATDDQLEAFLEYGYHAGVAFQLRDDMLGLSPDALGKSKNDLSEGKKTIILLRALEQLKESDEKTLLSCLGSSNQDDIKKGLSLISQTDAFQYNQEIYEKHCKKAIDAIDRANIQKESKEFLKGLAKYVIERGN